MMPSKLQSLLTQMLTDGQQRAQVPQKRKLQSGLHVTVTCHAKGVTLAIARDNVYPSVKEWETVLNHFPYFVGKPQPIYHIDSTGRKAFRAELPTRQAVAQKLL